MPAMDFGTQLRGSWEQAQGFLITQLTRLMAQLSPLNGLLAGILTVPPGQAAGATGYPVSSVLVTDSLGASNFSAMLPGPLAFSPTTTVTPTLPLAANTNDYVPPSIGPTAVIRLAASPGAINLTGLVAPTIAGVRLLVNIGTQDITVTHADTASTATNQFRCAGGSSVTLTAGRAVWIWYDAASTVWQVIG